MKAAVLAIIITAIGAPALAQSEATPPPDVVTMERDGEVTIVTSNGARITSPSGMSTVISEGDVDGVLVRADGVMVAGEVVSEVDGVTIVEHADGSHTVITRDDDGGTTTVSFTSKDE